MRRLEIALALGFLALRYMAVGFVCVTAGVAFVELVQWLAEAVRTVTRMFDPAY